MTGQINYAKRDPCPGCGSVEVRIIVGFDYAKCTDCGKVVS